ncbi:MAG: beta-1,6-N-acetylglucosaminyltransferase [Marinilabiliaceae bacterium]|nr:beta-1,6-N-acetylglucosaminyltransferase [Marinilabiliaceae bacterium]
MNHVYMVLTHLERCGDAQAFREQMEFLVEMLRSDNSSIVIHLDKKNDLSLLSGIESERVHLIKTDIVDVRWGDISEVYAEFRLLKEAKKYGPFDYYHLISGTDMPIKSQAYINEFFESHRGKEFVGFSRGKFHEEALKYRSQNYILATRWFREHRSLLCRGGYAINKLSVKFSQITGLKRHYKLTLYKGPQWFSITDALATHVLEREQEVRRMFKYTFSPDEVFLQTIVADSPFYKNVYDIEQDRMHSCLRKVDWKRGNPYVFTKEDIEDFRNSEAIFARKIIYPDKEFKMLLSQLCGK